MQNFFKNSILVLFFLAPLLSYGTRLSAQNSYNIKVKINGFDKDTLYMGYHYGDKQFLKDTAIAAKDRTFVFKNNKKLNSGIYLFIMPPNNEFVQVIIDEKQTNFSIEVNKADPYRDYKIKGNDDAELFFKYMTYLSDKRKEAEGFQKLKETDKKISDEKLDKLDKEVREYQKNLVTKFPKSITSLIVKSAQDIDIPEYKGAPADKELTQYLFYKEHYFDNVDFSNPALMFTPVLPQKIDYYIEKLTPQHPDSINISLDKILKLAEKNEEVYKYFLIQFVNSYLKSNIMGMDAVVVHLSDKYLKTGKADFIEKEQLDKIIKNADAGRNLLIGMKAPDLTCFDSVGKKFTLSQIKAKYKIVVIWEPDCGHCKKSIPIIDSFYQIYKPKGVEVFAICHKGASDIKKCWDDIKARKLNWINVVDPFQTSRFSSLYNAVTTPQVYIMDENMKILAKNIPAEDLAKVFDQMILEDAKKLKTEKE
jgi:thiol-disulfide isomerase/thioredoxin